MLVDGSASGPICVRQAPYLALGNLGGNAHPRSSIMFPSHLRFVVRDSFGLNTDDLIAEPGGDDTAHDSAAVVRLRTDLQQFASLAPLRAAQVLSCLNCLTEQPLVADLMSTLPPLLADSHVDLARAWYEAARGLVRLGVDEQQGADVLRELTLNAPSRVATTAGIQLGAYHLRIAHDLGHAEEVLTRTRQLLEVAEHDDDCPTAEATLLVSRFHRLEALFHTRARDRSGQARAMDLAEEHSRRLLAAANVHPYELLLAEENHKIVCEARIKAAAFGRDAAALATWSGELMGLDPEDPTSWRCIAEAAAQLGLCSVGRLALVGQAALGGLGVHNTLDIVEHAASDDDRSGEDRNDGVAELEMVLQSSLANLWLGTS